MVGTWWHIGEVGGLGPIELYQKESVSILFILKVQDPGACDREISPRKYNTYTWEFDAAVTTFWRGTALFDMKISEAASGGFHYADFV